MRWRLAAAAAALVCAPALGCAPPTSSSSDEGSATLPGADLSEVEVDTPELAKIKKRAGIPDCPRESPDAAPVEDGLPSLTLPCLGGGRDVDLSSLRGKPTVLNVWASWCDPCRKELPMLQRLHQSGKVRVVGVDVSDPQPATALELARDSGVTYPSLADPSAKTKEPLRMVGPPHTVFVAADGTVAGTERGVFTSYDDLAGSVRDHLGVQP